MPDKGRVTISATGVSRAVEVAPVRFGVTVIGEAHWQALLRVSSKAEGALMAALARAGGHG